MATKPQLLIVLAALLLLAACETGVGSSPTEDSDSFATIYPSLIRPIAVPTKIFTLGPLGPTETPKTIFTREPTESRATQTKASPDATAPPASTQQAAAPTPEQPQVEPTITYAPPTATNTAIPQPDRDEAQVIEVIDGDTLRVSLGGSVVDVRLIGVDTPETKDPNEPVMCFGPEATAFTTDMVDRAGGTVLLERDVSESDRYGRLLRYVWLPHPDGERFLNQELVAQGYAQVSTYPPDVKYQELFLEAQRAARSANAGLWGTCGDFGVPLVPPTHAPQPPAPPSGGNCHPSYDVCIPPPPPDLDCTQIDYRNFGVSGSDPHGFDRDQDGIGCEA